MIDLDDKKKQQEVLDAIKEISEEMHKMDVSRDQIKEIIIASSSAFNIEKPLLRKVARMYHKRTAAQFESETADIKNLYSAITLS